VRVDLRPLTEGNGERAVSLLIDIVIAKATDDFDLFCACLEQLGRLGLAVRRCKPRKVGNIVAAIRGLVRAIVEEEFCDFADHSQELEELGWKVARCEPGQNGGGL
jgi:hypothetical protein